ncbi:bifunctional precorrin-2 dehydrogenase/sirohydrochlorin ferrochelatase [Vibrio sp. B1FLJ16]|uniref:precorrin-2 dehydrogenase/sirohydrochlorin ferrochelatase family protein n=1 Tax=Vibrio sp. B1FLJ16 TaxID=2751178 RepID=UPI0015F4F566|nr:bifunctional precorrin-2 dehydrogenase/sirohydrochlorin ferrochelatase [Vibrio sp. B1FLJ16]CAD7805687.1 COG1648 Siroheme synthase (precorrin-2 oxidase ferrochelatase domain) [Vibrio sp. B1FLJ16]CAE6901401.1 COG1648 Siroheme synthase (precorrin-2 oxidase ferrochelatase domain) [Vibrio sp. B1FLJ16]
MRYFPLFLDLINKPVLVVGGGEVASRKVEALLKAGADVTIVSPTLVEYLSKLAKEHQLTWIQRFYSSDIVTKNFIQVWATTDNPDLNHQVHKDAKELGILVNVVDDKPYCDFITPSMINRGRIQIAISSGGASPVLIRNIRERLETILPQNMELVAEFANSKRNSIKDALPNVDLRRKFWELFFSNPDVENARDNRELETIYKATMANPLDEKGSCTWIYIDKDIEMLPIKAVRYMQQAELVLHSTRCQSDAMELVRRDAERESFSNAAELSDMLSQAKQDNLRVCVLVPQGTSEFALLQGQDLVI